MVEFFTNIGNFISTYLVYSQAAFDLIVRMSLRCQIYQCEMISTAPKAEGARL